MNLPGRPSDEWSYQHAHSHPVMDMSSAHCAAGPGVGDASDVKPRDLRPTAGPNPYPRILTGRSISRARIVATSWIQRPCMRFSWAAASGTTRTEPETYGAHSAAGSCRAVVVAL